MQGIVIDEESKYVKAAIVKIFKMQDPADGADTEAEAVTYALTDENGRFVIWDLDPDENYTIQIHVKEIDVKISETAAETETDSKGVAHDFIENENIDEEDAFIEAENIDEEDDLIEEDNTVEAVNFFQTNGTGDMIFFVQNEELTGTYFTSDLRPETELKEKLYAIRNYTW